MKIIGLYVVRNEADIVEASIGHHLSHGVDEVLVLDNGSTDGTAELLDRLAHGGRVRWASQRGPFRSAQMYTQLAREAATRGADWALPTGADEFWFARAGTLATALAQTAATVLEVDVVTFIQRRGQRTAEASGLLIMTRRAPRTIGPPERAGALMISGVVSYVELDHPTRIIFRPSPEIELGPGAHRVMGTDAAMGRMQGIQLLHAPLRARNVLLSKADKGRRIEQAGYLPGTSFHLRHWASTDGDDLLDREWAANSYDEGSKTLSVAGVAIQTIHDPTLQILATPLIAPTRELAGRGADNEHGTIRTATPRRGIAWRRRR